MSVISINTKTRRCGTLHDSRFAQRSSAMLKTAFILLLTVLAVSGCVSQQAVTEAPKPAPQILVMGSSVDLYNIDPAVAYDTAITSTDLSLYDNLYRHEGNPPKPVPWLAVSYDVSPDAKEWTFHLRKDARFHDGSPVTAESVKYSADRLIEIDKGPASLFQGIIDKNSTIVVDNYTVKFRLLKPFSPFLDIIPWLFIVNPKIVEEHRGDDFAQSWLSENEAGSGPFTISKWVPGEVYTFQAFDAYWRGWPIEGRLAGYTRKTIKEWSDRRNALVNGSIQLADWVAPDDQVVLKSVNNMTVIDEPTLELYEIKMNNAKGYTSNVHVRKAISYAFDYDALANIWAGRAKLASGPLIASSEWNANLAVYRLNMTKAKQELAQSPWPNGGFDLDYVYVTGLDEEKQTGVLIKEQLQMLNITVNIIPMSWTDAVVLFADPNKSPDMFPLYSSTAYSDPDNYLWSGYHSSQAGQWTNPGHYINPEVDLLLEKARGTIDINSRKQFYDQAQSIIVDDAANIFGVNPPDFHAWSPTVKGLVYCPIMGSEEEFYWLRIE